MTTAKQVDARTFASTVFDYIIVGAGTAGLVVAARLSEDPSVQVGVIEAGDWDPSIPGVSIPGNPRHDWNLYTVPQQHANGKALPLPRGKGLGGSSTLNIAMLDRAPAHEYDAIEALGNPGWNWNEFLKYFKKSETAQPSDPEHAAKHALTEPNTNWHGTSGPLLKSYPLHFALGPLQEKIVRAHENLGVPFNVEASNGNKTGYTQLFTCVDSATATRTNSATAYYVPNAHRENLMVLTGAVASKITFKTGISPLQATGVEFIFGAEKHHVCVSKEVILSAGSFQSPQILELSGIGNREVLSQHGVETLVDLPAVGENLQVIPTISDVEHIHVPVLVEVNPQYETLDALRQPEVAARAMELYSKKQGPMIAVAAASSYSFIPASTFMSMRQIEKWTNGAQAVKEQAPAGLQKQYDTQIKLFRHLASAEGEVMPFPGFLPRIPMEPTPGTGYLTLVAAILHPLSRGSVHIASGDPLIAPAIDPSFLSRQEDLDVLLAITKFALKLTQTEPLSGAVRKLCSPTPDVAASDDALVRHIKENYGCVHHPVGTASMLPKEDGGVVDPELRVYGTLNVRVVDASILPLEIAAHPQATVYAIAEKAADIIRGL
ncbi:GMC oxidoreductase [Daedaleopsis nitida]|nr:GMC oxidoreductase [Daedaleopsis nitida]